MVRFLSSANARTLSTGRRVVCTPKRGHGCALRASRQLKTLACVLSRADACAPAPPALQAWRIAALRARGRLGRRPAGPDARDSSGAASPAASLAPRCAHAQAPCAGAARRARLGAGPYAGSARQRGFRADGRVLPRRRRSARLRSHRRRPHRRDRARRRGACLGVAHRSAIHALTCRPCSAGDAAGDRGRGPRARCAVRAHGGADPGQVCAERAFRGKGRAAGRLLRAAQRARRGGCRGALRLSARGQEPPPGV